MQTIFIVTATLNCENEIKNCIESVLKVKKKIVLSDCEYLNEVEI